MFASSRAALRQTALAGALLAVLAPTLGAADGQPEWRSIDGSGNNPIDAERGKAGMPLLRLAAHSYADRVSEPAGQRRPSARAISNAMASQISAGYNAEGLSDYAWLWGQFVDHDIDLTPGHQPAEPMPIEVPTGDPWFDPSGTGAQIIVLNRSMYDPETGNRRNNPRRQLNMITSWIDGSNVYGSDPARARALRKSNGLLRTSAGDLLPYNTHGLDNAGGTDPSLFVAGDVRANEQVSLTAMHTLWVREHNRYARKLRRDHPGMSGDEVYERTRAWVGALLQVITYREFLPALLGEDALPEYSGWNPWVDGTIAQEFSTAAYRFGHSMVSARLMRVDRNGSEIPEGHLELRDAFFAPHQLAATGIDPVLRGLAYQQAREVDNMVVDELRNFLFGPPGAGGFDLAALNIQRGRDHGLEDFNQIRLILGLPPYYDFDEVATNAVISSALEQAYGDIGDIDLWVGGLAEEHVPGSVLGPTFHEIIRDQFQRLRDGDRFFYLNVFSGNDLHRLENTSLADVIRRNTDIGDEIPDDVFHVR